MPLWASACVAAACALAMVQPALAAPERHGNFRTVADQQRLIVATAHRVAKASALYRKVKSTSGMQEAISSGVPVDHEYLAMHQDVASQARHECFYVLAAIPHPLRPTRTSREIHFIFPLAIVRATIRLRDFPRHSMRQVLLDGELHTV